ncbi:MAG: 6-pyruvoyl tetrahydropterin synthase family protein [Pirellulaceae bacterium]
MKETYRVRVTKDYLVFSAGHFITFNGDTCERLHGHNYAVEAEVTGPLDQNHYVIDFIALRDSLKQIVDQLDHHMLLPTSHPLIHVRTENKEVHVQFEDRRWVFPECDCVLLPVPNTTTELLAKYIGQKLLEDLKDRISIDTIQQLRISVDENNGQWGDWIAEWDSTES